MQDLLSIKVALEPLYILHKLRQNNFEAYIVGGAVRDILIESIENKMAGKLTNNTYHIKASDYDFTTSAKPEQIQKTFPENFYENKFGTVSVTRTHLREQMNLQNIKFTESNSKKLFSSTFNKKTINLSSATKIHESLKNNIKNNQIEDNKLNINDKKNIDDNEVYEITTFRSDGEYLDYRRPEDVSWGESLQSDLNRRDFSINAMAIKISDQFLNSLNFKESEEIVTINPDNFEVIDQHFGMKDLQNEIIKTVGNPDERFNQDALRLLRAIRFSIQLNMQIDDQTFEAIIKNSHLIQHVSWERIRDELLKMLSSNYPKEAIKILDETGLLKIIIPELIEGKGVMQGGHHISDVWNHNLDSLDNCPSIDPIVRLATLLHDIGKPRTLKIIDGKPTFYNHEIIGSRIAKDIAKRLKLSKIEIERIFILVRYHMFHYQPENTDSSIRRFMKKVGLENINDILDLREADRIGSGATKSSWRLEEMKQRMVEQLHQPFSISDLAINGNDLMKELNIQPGRIVGEILNTLFEEVIENPELNSKNELLKIAKRIVTKL
ncbi:MAG: HD domain-containing protein [Pseudomonadales bacterium]|nr:HD domain-containing protein [Pseudomonadales bacterium]